MTRLLTQGIGLRPKPWAPFSRPVRPEEDLESGFAINRIQVRMQAKLKEFRPSR
jgi:hypothetical protein